MRKSRKRLWFGVLLTLLCLLTCFGLFACGKGTPKVIGISMQSQTEESYVDEFDYTDYTILVAYNDGSTEQVALTRDCVS